VIHSVKVLLFILILLSVCVNTIYSCTYQESMTDLSPMIYMSGKKVLNELYDYNTCKSKYTNVIWHIPDNNANVSTLVLPSESLLFYGATESRPECCGPTCGIKMKHKRKTYISKTSGCPCMSNEQIRYLRNRGGNSIQTYDNTIF